MALLVGDLHGKFGRLRPILEGTEDEVICLGDVGVGFPGIGKRPLFRKNFKFIRGNHDCPDDCRAHPQYLGDYGVYQDLFFISGAKSVDKHRRTENWDWWREEELDKRSLDIALDLYAATKPDVVISHDCPFSVQWPICVAVRKAFPWTEEFGDPRGYPTVIAMDEMLKIHRPKAWYFGHWHLPWQLEEGGTLFRCLDELETMPLTLPSDMMGA